MKLFSAILAIYIMGLLLVPCADLHAENGSEISYIKIPEKHQDHFDTCSPFCFCNCCQTLSQPALYYYFNHFDTVTGTTVHVINTPEYSVSIPFWRPPKI
jgi:hypothetical protein